MNNMNFNTPRLFRVVLVFPLLLSSCSTPTLVEIARRRQAGTSEANGSSNVKDDVRVKYEITDWDVLNFTDEVKRKLSNRSKLHLGVRYGSAATQATLGTLAGAVKTFGWSAGTASGLGLGATYIFGMGQIFDSRSHAQAYEQAYTAIQSAEASFYFHQTGMQFIQVNGKWIYDPTSGEGTAGIPSQKYLTPDGETLYYRTTKILKVLDDALVSKIPDLEDLKEANGESSSRGTPAKNTTSPPGPRPPGATPKPKPSPGSEPGDNPNVKALRGWWMPHGTVDKEHEKLFVDWLAENEEGVAINTYLSNPLYKLSWPKARAKLVPGSPPASPAPTDSDDKVLYAWWKPNGVTDKDRTQQFNEWLKTNEAGISIADFLNNAAVYKKDWPKARAALVH